MLKTKGLGAKRYLLQIETNTETHNYLYLVTICNVRKGDKK